MTLSRRSLIRLATATAACGMVLGSGAVGAGTTTPPTTTPSTTAPPTTVPPTTVPRTTVPRTTAAPTTVAPTTTAAPAPTHPLLGVPIDNPAAYTPRPALIVKIDNGVNSKPQSGLNEADIVFEEIVEGRVTRFAAVFNSRDSDPVGNIRSGRSQDVDLFMSYNDPIFAYSGGNAAVNAVLFATGWTILGQGDGMFRVSGRGGAPYNLFANTSDLFSRAGDAGEAVPQFEYGATSSGTPVGGFDLAIGSVRVSWTWDAEEGWFERSENGSPHQTTTGQVSTNNVVVLFAPYGRSAADSSSPEAQSVGSGDVVVYREGQRIDGTWTRESASDPFTLTTAAGEPLLLQPGRTFVELADAATDSVTDR